MTRRWLRAAAVAAAVCGTPMGGAAGVPDDPQATAQAPAAAEARRPPAVGDLAPAFTLPGSDGQMHSLSDHLGRRPIVIAWFPRVFATR